MHDSDDEREAQAWCALRNDDPRLAFRLFLRLAMEGSANAQYQLGHMFFGGEGVREDEALAARWYRTAAEQGHAKAQCDYAWCLDAGVGVPCDLVQSAAWLRRSAQQGNRNAQYALGMAYERGEGGMPHDIGRAVHWYRLAAVQRHEEAVARLTVLLSLAPVRPATSTRATS
jgi:hypothetical protein